MCPVCNLSKLDKFVDPIEYWACQNCQTVFVVGHNGTIGCLDVKVKYET